MPTTIPFQLKKQRARVGKKIDFDFFGAFENVQGSQYEVCTTSRYSYTPRYSDSYKVVTPINSLLLYGVLYSVTRYSYKVSHID